MTESIESISIGAGSAPTKPSPLNIYFYSVESTGHLNSCFGLAQSLSARGHRVTFVLGESLAGKQFAQFNEVVLRKPPAPIDLKVDGVALAPPNATTVHRQARVLQAIGFIGPKSPLEKYRTFSGHLRGWLQKFVEHISFANDQLGEALAVGRPDLIIVDHMLLPPAILKAAIPWVYLCSGNPLRVYNHFTDLLPPFCSGLPVDSDPESWKEYHQIWESEPKQIYRSLQEMLNKAYNYDGEITVQSRAGYCLISPYLNIYGYPLELDYTDVVSIPATMARTDTFCRVLSEQPFELPECLRDKPGKWIYLSLGSLGSIDLELMRRIVDIIGRIPHRFIVSKGPVGDQLELPSGGNCWGANYLPQPSILPLVDLVVTHGGNNTTTETFSFAKPMVVMPLFGDQYDNAERIQQKGFGVRLDPYRFTLEELTEAIDRLVNDRTLEERLQKAANRIREDNGKELLCARIESLVQQ